MKTGIVYGEQTTSGYNITRNPVHVHDFHATMLHLDWTMKLTARHLGPALPLTDVHGRW